ncbi:Exostosin-2 [Sarcoptes scabiei]|uniref:Exostosin-2 n=1 Tax=Sarcoptes scabiei TaxID=52283 RepID=A0A834VE02_SARSC|nr:Exostosin-2 [Sarcoptes scabiei]
MKQLDRFVESFHSHHDLIQSHSINEKESLSQASENIETKRSLFWWSLSLTVLIVVIIFVIVIFYSFFSSLLLRNQYDRSVSFENVPILRSFLSSILSSCWKIIYFPERYKFGPSNQENSLENVTEKEIFLPLNRLTLAKSIEISDLEKQQQQLMKTKCSHHSCFNPYLCGPHDASINQRNYLIKIFIYPRYEFDLDLDSNSKNQSSNGRNFDVESSLEFDRLLTAIIKSPYFTNDSRKACLFIPNIDTLNRDRIDLDHWKRMLWSLPYFRSMNGSNHLLWMMTSINSHPKVPSIANAMIASGILNDRNYRLNFDIAIPIYSVFSKLHETSDLLSNDFVMKSVEEMDRRWLIISTQTDFLSKPSLNSLKHLKQKNPKKIFSFSFNCQSKSINHLESSLTLFTSKKIDSDILKQYQKTILCDENQKLIRYVDLLHQSQFCLLIKNRRPGMPWLTDSLMSGCIPVIIDDDFVLPFQEYIDWFSVSIQIKENYLDSVVDILSKISVKRRKQLRINGMNIWSRYFRSIEDIAITTLDIINDRINSKPKNIHTIVNNEFRELVPLSKSFFINGFNHLSPKFINLISNSFTAVILTYNRLESLTQVIVSVSRVSSCSKILIIWNNQALEPPPIEFWSKYTKIPLQVIRMRKNLLNNRFLPFDSIETEAIFSIDDDITMLNHDEIEFAYQTWREFPDRIVGFPSRLHYWNNQTQSWIYDSEWKNKISLILTGAAFYHKYYNHLYTMVLPKEIRNWIDDNFNCEDIAMNFLISNVTSKAPIKVTPRKKFKCTDCAKKITEGLTEHFRIRSYCIDYFAKIYQTMPLKVIEFRSSPVQRQSSKETQTF